MSGNNSHEIMDTQKDLFDAKKSTLTKYQEIVVGKRGLWNMIKYELIITLFSWVPGALGLALRQIFLKVSGAILSDQVKCLDWKARVAEFICELPSGVT